MFEHIYCIPTHRVIDNLNLNNFFLEVRYANTIKKNIPLVIFEDNDKQINKELISEYSKKYKDIKVVYITRKTTKKVYDIIKDKLSNKAAESFNLIYPNNRMNYGNILNRIFIFSDLMGADYITRRDSDILIEVDENGEKVFPIKYELNLLGKKNNDNVDIIICGGGYKGEYSIDIGSFVDDDDYSKVKKMFTCISIPEEFHDEIIEKDILQICDDQPDVVTEDADFPHGGNIGLYDLHHFLPSSPQNDVLGSDYFITEISSFLGLGLAHHNRSVIHKHTKERKKDHKEIKRYWKSFIAYVDAQNYYREFYERYVMSGKYEGMSLDEAIKFIPVDMTEFLEKFPNECFDIRTEKYREGLEFLASSSDSEIISIEEEFQNEKIDSEIFAETEKSINDHIKLLSNWREIISVCDDLKGSDEITAILNDCILN